MIKHIQKGISAMIMVSCCCAVVHAVPAKPGLLSVTCADGTVLKVHLVGDENFHQYYTEDGYPLVEMDGGFYYCDYSDRGELRNSGIRATDIGKRDATAGNFLKGVNLGDIRSRVREHASQLPRKERIMRGGAGIMRSTRAAEGAAPPYERGYGLFPDVHFPAYGEQKAIVILVEYQDTKFRLDNPHDYFSRMLNETGFSDYGSTGSAKEYFSLNSGGTFNCDFDVFGPVTLSKSMAYYGGNDYSGDDKRPGLMVKEACEQLDGQVDFSVYDRDGDGLVDNVFIIYAGLGEASGGTADTMWPHSWDMVSAGYPNLVLDGVRIHTYGCSNEWEGKKPDGVGTFIHEFSHVMGLPDLYSTTYNDAFTPGEWSVLDYGPYNNEGRTPPLYGAFERYALGWMKPMEIEELASRPLKPIGENEAAIIRTSKDTEFFLVENRQQTGWDTHVPGHGMLVWHVDYKERIWSGNKVNNTVSHQYVDLIEADDLQTEFSRDGDCYPGASGNTELSAASKPALKMWDKTALDVALTDIREVDGNIEMTVSGSNSAGMPAVTGGASSIEREGRVLRAQGEDIMVHDLSGRTVAHGRDEVILPASGFYIVTLPDSGETVKMLVK